VLSQRRTIELFELGNTGTCSDGKIIRPVFLNQCPSPADELPDCENATVGQKCVFTGSGCEADAKLYNCPPSLSIFTKLEPDLIDIKRFISQGLTIGATFFFILSSALRTVLLRFMVWKFRDPVGMLRKLFYVFVPCCLCSSYDEDWFFSGVLTLLAYCLLTFVAIGFLMPWTMYPVACLVVALHIFCLLYHSCVARDPEFLSEDMRVSGEEAEKAEADWIAVNSAFLELPVLGVYVSLRQGGAQAAILDASRYWYKLILRLVTDIPLLAIDAVDLYTFGVSWYAALSMVASVIEVVVYVVLRIKDGVMWLKDGVDKQIDRFAYPATIGRKTDGSRGTTPRSATPSASARADMPSGRYAE